MKICFWGDLHLPFDNASLQYDVLEWAIADVKKKNTDCIVFVGDATSDGNIDVYNFFIKKVQETEIPFIYIPGNSDLRCKDSRNTIYGISSPCKNKVGLYTIFAVNDSDKNISENDMRCIAEADERSIVFMHYPIEEHIGNMAALFEWKKEHTDTPVFFGHMHYSGKTDNLVSIQAMDPDKAIGECPCITYYDTETEELTKAYYFCPPPVDLYNYFGFSCYRIENQIELAIKNGIKNLEIRPNCLDIKKTKLKEAVNKWRSVCGENLSIHLPDIAYKDGEVLGDDRLDAYIELVKELKADRITQHVPVISLKAVKDNPDALEEICSFLADRLNSISTSITVGVENMHMTSEDTSDDNRRFGYTPEECLRFMEILSLKCRHKVGINFDIGHARNNALYSQKYQISTWFSILGKHIVGYHIHQVNYENGAFENHMPISDIYGSLISFASFFKCWSTDRINKAPVIFEMRPKNAYEETLKTFNAYKNKKVFDIHSHTHYSNCGRDNPYDLINTAIQNGLSVFGICDHNYGIGDRKQQYLNEMRRLGKEYSDKIKLYCGIEIATLPEIYDIKSSDEIKDFDYCLVEHITYDRSIVKDKLFEFCKKLGILCGIAHTDLFAYCDIWAIDYVEFFEKMAQNNIFWEMNVSYDSIHKYNEHQYVLDFMKDTKKQKIIKDAGVYISIGFDSHRYEDYDGYRVHQMYDFLQKNKINTIDKLLSDSY